MPTRTASKSAPKSGKAATRRPSRRKAAPVPTPPAHKYLSGNALVCGDNLDVLKELPDESVDLIYLDPPFNSKHNYVAAFGDKGRVDAQLRDIWRWTVETENAYQRLPHGKLLDAVSAIRLVSGNESSMAAYAVFMGRRLAELHRVLKPQGSIYLHCDPNANWLLRVLLDTIFGEGHFLNEIIWKRPTAHSDSGRYGANTDTILFYAKGQRWAWRPQFQDYDEKYRARFNRQDPDGRLWADYDLTAKGLSGGGYEYKGATSLWRVPLETMKQWDADGKLHFTTRGGIRRKRYLDEMEGRPLQALWDDIAPVNSQAAERIGYPTQKPLALLERIIQASSNEDALVLDPFCGCGTAADAAAKLGRRYLGIDISAIAVRVMEQRLASRGGTAMPAVYQMDWDDYEWDQFESRALMKEADAEDGIPGWAWAEDKVAGLLNALPNDKKTGDGGVDARYFTERGEIIPIQVKMYKGQIGRPEMQKLLGVQTEWRNRKVKSPMSLMVTLYPPRETLRVFARQQGDVTLRGERYPKMQVLSVQEMLTKQVRPKLPPVDPRYFVGDTQTRFAIAQ